MSSIVTVSGVSFEFSNGRVLFQNLNFSLNRNVVALVGPNGVGKSTLARLLTGECEPTQGSISCREQVTFFSQRAEPPAISVDEYLAEKYAWSELGEKLLDGIDRSLLCTYLSGGQWMRVRLTHALSEEFLILDEPTNDLDREGRQALLQFLRESENGVLLISHDRECLQLCDEVLELSNKGLSKFGGGWEAYEQAREKEREALKNQLELAKRNREAAKAERVEQIARQDKRNRRGAEAAARGGMPKILLGGRKRRAQTTTGKIDVATLEKANEAVREAFEAYSELKIDPLMYADILGSPIPAGKLVAEARDFNVRFRDWLYPRDLHFSWRGNARVALKGGNGSGKSTLLKAILGESFETHGELRSGKLAALYVDQRCASLTESKSVFENIREVCSAEESEIRNSLAQFLFTKESVFQKVETLSGGERLRAALAKGFLSQQKPELLILDEPTNNLDLVNVEFLEKLVSQFPGALLIISHDEVFLKNCGVTSELVLDAGK